LIVAIVLLVMATSSAYSTQFVFPFLKHFRPDLVIHSLLSQSTLATFVAAGVRTIPFATAVVIVVPRTP